ncbi:hypothetical protein D3C77_716300 [compost metagenome]
MQSANNFRCQKQCYFIDQLVLQQRSVKPASPFNKKGTYPELAKPLQSGAKIHLRTFTTNDHLNSPL